jgi:hypothetical protein
MTLTTFFKSINECDKSKLQILDTCHDFGKAGIEISNIILDNNELTKIYPNFEPDVRDHLYKDIEENKILNVTNIYEILDKLFEGKEDDRKVVVERSGKGGLTTFGSAHCFDKNKLYTNIYSKANQYDNYAATERSDITTESCVVDKTKDITITTTKDDDGLLVIDTVELSNNEITYEIDEQPKTINFKTDFKFGSQAILKFLQFIEQRDEISGHINEIFKLDYSKYYKTPDARKKYIKCLFDFKRLGDLQLIKVAAENNIPFITGDRLAAIIANYCYNIPSLFISSNSKPELYTKKKQCIIYEEAKNIVDYLGYDISDFKYAKNIADYGTNAEQNIQNLKEKYEEKYGKDIISNYLRETIEYERQKKPKNETTGGNPQDLPEKINEDRWYYALGLFKIIDEYVPRDKGTVGDNTVLLFQYMLLGYMYDLHDEDVIDYVASQRTPYNIQQSVSKDTYTDVYNNNYNGIGYTATSIPIPIMVGGKQNTTKFMKNVIKDFKKLFV